MYWIGVIAAIIFSADFFIKHYLREHFAFQSLPVIPGLLHITVIFNKGAAFGILPNQTVLLTCMSIVFIAVFAFFIKKEQKRKTLFFIACGMILGGALSNLYDRLTLGFVVDYIDVRIWPVFNLSDACISIGAFFLLFDALKRKKTSLP